MMQKKVMMHKFSVFLLATILLTACGSDESIDSSALNMKKSLPEPNSAGAKLIKKYCSNCHGAPMPGVHKQNEWRNVVYRMNIRRKKRALGEIPEVDFDAIVFYMEKHSQ